MSSSEQVTTPVWGAAETPAMVEGYALPPMPGGTVPGGPVAGGPVPGGPVAGGPVAGAPAPKQGRVKTAIIAAVAAVVLGVGGVAVANAVNSSNTGTTQNGGPGGGPGGNFGGNGMFNGGGRGAASGLSGALHGDFVASDGNGGYITKRLQSGTVTAVGSSSITAKSADGYSTTFTVNSSTTVNNGNDQIGDVKSGDTVTIVGTVSGSTVTATTITDPTLGQANGNQQNGQVPPGQPQNGTTTS